MPAAPTPSVEAFISRWEAATGSERANYQLFLTELCALLDLPQPDPARDDTRDNAYVFERRVTFRHGDGSESSGFIDLYRRAAFVCEAKKLRQTVGKGFDDAMLRARGQAEQYARALPAAEGRPPFVLVVDVGQTIELYSEFSRSGATYTPFPDPRSHRIRLVDLRDEALRERLRQIWREPLSLDPARHAARVTREIAVQLAKIAQTLEGAGHSPEGVAGFLTRCLFSMFAEDVGLLPKRAFVELLESLKGNPAQFVPLVGELWQAMDAGAFSVAIRADVLRFNGKLFRDATVLSLDRDQIALLLQASKFDWRQVEPAIFGTLLERALVPEERHALGAHYTPRAYVERLVLPTVVEPLREDWKNAQGAALVLAGEGKLAEARAEIHTFHHRLCEVRVLDPACGSGNFLYVTLEHLKRLEGEVLNQLEALGEAQQRLDITGITVDPHQLLGLELNPRAAAIAEMVLWIGYLQWHFRTRGQVLPPQPVLKDFHNIEHRDAVLAYDRMEYVTDERGVPVSRWDGKTVKKHPVTGEDVPDDTARVPLERYVNPRKAEWPQADFVVGNPPFLGKGKVRDALGDGYIEALRGVWKEVPDSADFVMYWWHQAADLTRTGKLRRFGLITTNSLRQTFNRRIIEQHLAAKPALSLAFAIPDHPWVDSADGAAVRIAMTVGQAGVLDGRCLQVQDERENSEHELDVSLGTSTGTVHADLTIGANVASARSLEANGRVANTGFILGGRGFVLTRNEAEALRKTSKTTASLIYPLRNGEDILSHCRDVFVIDAFGWSEARLLKEAPGPWQILRDRVFPERQQNRDDRVRKNWWLFRRSNEQVRASISALQRFIVTAETAKHRVFCFLETGTRPEHRLVVFGFDDALALGVLASRVHVSWALAAGGTLEDRPVYNKTRCFETFPFPVSTAAQQSRIRDLAEQLDVHRKHQQAQHPDLTLTGMYNVLEKLKAGEALNAKDKVVHEQGLVSVLKQLHDELDLAVLDAYGWSDFAPLMNVVNGNAAASDPHPSPLPQAGEGAVLANREDCKRALDDALLERLVALNTERAAEEKRGLIRWLRPEFQHPTRGAARPPTQIEMPGAEAEAAVVAKSEKLPWPKELPEQVRLVAQALALARVPLSIEALSERFSGKGPWKKRLPQLVETLVSLGRARRVKRGVLSVD